MLLAHIDDIIHIIIQPRFNLHSLGFEELMSILAQLCHTCLLTFLGFSLRERWLKLFSHCLEGGMESKALAVFLSNPRHVLHNISVGLVTSWSGCQPRFSVSQILLANCIWCNRCCGISMSLDIAWNTERGCVCETLLNFIKGIPTEIQRKYKITMFLIVFSVGFVVISRRCNIIAIIIIFFLLSWRVTT